MSKEYDDEPLLLDSKAVARRLSLSLRKVQLLMEQGNLPVVHIGKSVRVSTEALRAWIKQLEEEERARNGGTREGHQQES